MTTRRQNFIFIVADDLGYADLGCCGGRPGSFGAVSPAIVSLAADGIRFTQGYANAPVCSPTRFAMITGSWQYRLRGAADEPMNPRARGNPALGLPPEHPTLPSLLRKAGWRTALMGKWHLGYPPHFSPLKSGYDSFYGPMSGGVDYFSHCGTSGAHDLFEGDEEIVDPGYLTVVDARRRAPERRRACQALPLGRRQHSHLPAHDPPHGRRHRPRPAGAGAPRRRRRHAGGLHQRQRR